MVHVFVWYKMMVLSGVTDGDCLCVLLPAETKTLKKERASLWQFPFPAGCVRDWESAHMLSLFWVSICKLLLFFLSFPHVCLPCFVFFFELKIPGFSSPRIFLQSSQAWCWSVSVIHAYSFLHLHPTLSFFPFSLTASVARAESYTKMCKQSWTHTRAHTNTQIYYRTNILRRSTAMRILRESDIMCMSSSQYCSE